jgi:hypothetical protein
MARDDGEAGVGRRAPQISVWMLASFQLLAQGKERSMEHPTFYRTKQIDGLSIFYREAGPKDVPTLLLSRNFPLHYECLALNHFTEALGLYGGSVGFRMALAHPERVEALIVQVAVAHNEGLGANWKTRREFRKNRAANESALRTNLLSLQTTRTRHVGNDPNVDRYDPDLWTDEVAFLNSARPGEYAKRSLRNGLIL